MFRIVRDFVPRPALMLLCDRSCGTIRVLSMRPEVPEEMQQAAFIGSAVEEGWVIQLDRQVCPQHAKLEGMGINQSRVVVPN